MNKILLLAGICIFITSCNIINPGEEIPSYIHIEKFTLNTTSQQGTNSHKISDAWVYVDGNLQGVYELPVTFPVLYSGDHEITLYAGIKKNGISASREKYPFYKNFSINTYLPPKEVDTLSPAVAYIDELDFPSLWMESFEDAGLKLDTTINSDVNIVLFYDTIIHSQTGYINLHDELDYFECKSEELDLPKYSAKVYLELNYRCDIEFVIGLKINFVNNSVQSPLILLSQQSEWNKIYIDLGQTVTANPSAIDFNLFIGASLGEDVTEGHIYIDNLKILHL